MPYNTVTAEKIRSCLQQLPGLSIEEKKMFRGLTFMVNGKMCISVSGENLMCRFDAAREHEVAKKKGYLPVVMKGKEYKGFCYVSPEGYKLKKDFAYWIKLCLDFNEQAKASRKKSS